MRIARSLILLGSLVLFGVALFHGSGYVATSRALEGHGLKPLIVSGFKALWLMFSMHLALLSVVFVGVSRTLKRKQIVLLCALIPASDTVLLFPFLGGFIGAISVACATLLLLVGGLLLPQIDES